MGKCPVLQTVLPRKTGEINTTGAGDKEFRSTELCAMPKQQQLCFIAGAVVQGWEELAAHIALTAPASLSR